MSAFFVVLFGGKPLIWGGLGGKIYTFHLFLKSSVLFNKHELGAYTVVLGEKKLVNRRSQTGRENQHDQERTASEVVIQGWVKNFEVYPEGTGEIWKAGHNSITF